MDRDELKNRFKQFALRIIKLVDSMNSCVITVVEDDQVPALLESVKKLDLRNEEVGVRAFVWDIVATV